MICPSQKTEAQVHIFHVQAFIHEIFIDTIHKIVGLRKLVEVLSPRRSLALPHSQRQKQPLQQKCKPGVKARQVAKGVQRKEVNSTHCMICKVDLYSYIAPSSLSTCDFI